MSLSIGLIHLTYIHHHHLLLKCHLFNLTLLLQNLLGEGCCVHVLNWELLGSNRRRWHPRILLGIQMRRQWLWHLLVLLLPISLIIIILILVIVPVISIILVVLAVFWTTWELLGVLLLGLYYLLRQVFHHHGVLGHNLSRQYLLILIRCLIIILNLRELFLHFVLAKTFFV